MARAVGGRKSSPISGGAWVTTTPESSANVAALARAAGPETFGAVEEELGKLYTKAKELWPVKTGKSKATMAVRHRLAKDKVISSLIVGADYSYYVYSKKLGKNAARALVLDPSIELADRLATIIAKRLGD